MMSPEPTPEPTPEPMPEPTPEPTPELDSFTINLEYITANEKVSPFLGDL